MEAGKNSALVSCGLAENFLVNTSYSLYSLAFAIEPIGEVQPALLRLKELVTAEKSWENLINATIWAIDESLEHHNKYWPSHLPFILNMI